MSLPAVRAALRIARRDALRAKGRSALVIAMIGLPMFAVAAADVVIRTGELPAAERVRRDLGTADLVAIGVTEGPITQDGPDSWSPADAAGFDPLRAPDSTEAEVLKLLPPGSRVVRWHRRNIVTFSAPGRALRGELVSTDLADPLNAGVVRHRAGRLPAAPGEAAVTPAVASTLGVGVGGTVTLAGLPLRVTGIVVVPDLPRGATVFVAPSTEVPDEAGADSPGGTDWSVDLPPGVRDVDAVSLLNAGGFRARPRTWYFDPPPSAGATIATSTETYGIALVAVGLAALEVVLLAGTAFAVGARRRRHELALVVATGGDRRDVRRIVLAGGAVLGAAAGVLAVTGGIAVVFLGRPLLERFSGSLLGPLDVRPLELGAVVAVAVGTALLAAVLPARAAARQDVVASLTGRRGTVRPRRRVPVLALAAVVCGAALAFWAAGDGYVPGDLVSTGRRANMPLLLAGAVVAELGFVACAGSMVAAVARLGRRLPLAMRFAVRDAARHRTRSGPAVAAVVAAVAGSVAVSVYVASDTERQRRAYQPWYPVGAVTVAQPPPADADLVLRSVAAKLPVRERFDVRELGHGCDDSVACDHWSLEVPPAHRCPDEPGPIPERCRLPFGPLEVAPASYVAMWTGRDDPRVAGALADGKAVVFDGRWVVRGEVGLQLSDPSLPAGTYGDVVRVPAFVADAPEYGRLPQAVLTPETAKRLGLVTRPSGTVFTTTRLPTEAEQATAEDATERNRTFYAVTVERGFTSDMTLTLLALLAASTVVTVGATGIATGLAAADSRPDLATLAAVGAAPRLRRRLAMAQAATVAALGSALGVVAGLVPSVAVVAARAEIPLRLPWLVIAVTAAGVPLAAALVVGLFTRSRLPLERRLA